METGELDSFFLLSSPVKVITLMMGAHGKAALGFPVAEVSVFTKQ